MEYTLKDYQHETCEYMVKNPYSIIALKQGLGKTLCALHTVSVLKNNKTLIVAPSYLKHNWRKEILKFFPGKIITLIDKSSEIYKVWDSDFAIISYALAARKDAEYFFSWADIVIADESHYLKEMTAKRTDTFHRYVYENSVKRCYLLTGTPIQNRVYEFYSLMAICNYNPLLQDSVFLNKFPDFTLFAEKFSFPKEYKVALPNGRYRNVVSYSGIRNRELLKNFLKGIYIRFDDSVLDLPPVVFEDFLVSDTPNIELLNEFDRFVTDSNGSVKSNLKAQAALKTAPVTVEYAKDLGESEDKIVIYTDHVDSAIEIAKGLGVTAITGQVGVQSRDRIAENFTNGTSKYLVATYGAFSTGVTLTVSNTMVLNDFPWIPGVLEQAIYRIKRIGQTKTCFVHRMLGSPQTEYILNKLEEKSNTIKEIV